ncbi:MAG: hypothetical protein RLZZ126_523, partial [Pseudomonadota bacterium]
MNTSVDLAALISAIGDAIMVCDHQGKITLWNPASERIFGFTAEEAIGQSLDLIIPARQQQRHWDGYFQTMRTGVTKYGTALLKVPALHKDGRTLSIAFSVALVLAQDGSVSGIAAVVRDETVRFAQERDLRKRVSELEARLASPP